MAAYKAGKDGSRVSTRVCRLAPNVADAHPQCLELDQTARGRAGEVRLLPDIGGQCQHGEFGGGEGDGWQRVGVGIDPVAGLVLKERIVAAGLQRHPEFAQIVLVPLEHPVEGLFAGAARVLRHSDADLLLGEPPARRQQGDDEVEQPFGPLR